MQFRFGSIPVRVHVSFFVMTIVLGAAGLGQGKDAVAQLAMWVVVVALSIFAHELGHALMGRAFGLAPAVDLYAMGGLTSFSSGKPLSNGRKVLISLAGPAVGLAVAAVVLGALALGVVPGAADGGNPLAAATAQTLIWVNGYWS